MQRILLTAALGLAFSAGPAAARAPVDIDIEVYDDLGACATVTVSEPGLAAGVFAGAGAVNGPGSTVGTVRGVTPFTVAGPGSWYGCLADAYRGGTAGLAAYSIAVTTRSGETVAFSYCTVSNGAVSCA